VVVIGNQVIGGQGIEGSG